MKNPVTADRLPDSNSVQPTNADARPASVEPVPESKGKRFKHAAKEFFTTRKIAYLAVFSALSTVLYLFGFSVPILPEFLKFQFSDVPAIIGGFMLGPVSGCIVIVVKIAIKLVIEPTATFFVGELCDLLLGVTFVLTAVLIYKKIKNTKGAIIGLSVGALVTAFMAVLVNWAFIVPIYVKAFGGWGEIFKRCPPIFGELTSENFYRIYLPYAVFPFNFARGVVCSVLGYLLYYGLKKADKRLFGEKRKTKPLKSD